MAPNKLHSLSVLSGHRGIPSRGEGIAEYYLLRHVLCGYIVLFLTMINKEIIGLVKNHWGVAGLMLN